MSPPGGSSPWTPWDDEPEPTETPTPSEGWTLPPAGGVAETPIAMPSSMPDSGPETEAVPVVPPTPVPPTPVPPSPPPPPPQVPGWIPRPEEIANHSTEVVVHPDVAATPRPTRSARRTARRAATPKRARSRRRALIEWAAVLVVAVLLAFGLRAFAFQAFYVPSSSMVPTLQPGDRILVDKFLFNPDSLTSGDLIVFHTPPAAAARCQTTDPDLVKRVIGVPGDAIYSVDNTVYVNYSPLYEPYLAAGTSLGPAIGSPTDPVIVPANDYYVLGDNRSISCDSRYFGFVSAKEIVGRVVALIWRNNHPTFHRF